MKFLTVLYTIALTLIFMPFAADAGTVNWMDASPAHVVLFYPGATSWEFLTSNDHRLGGRDIKRVRKDCKHCHLSEAGELDLKADEIAAGTIKMKRSHDPFEPEPIPGKKGTMTADVRAAYDDDYLYIRVEWAANGAGWKQANGAASVPDRVSVQLNSVDKHFSKYGCFITCHNALNSMPGSPPKKVVAADPYYSKLKRDDVRLYAFYTRKGSWSERVDAGEFDGLLKERGRIDLRSVELLDGKANAMDGWVFDDRRWEEGGADEATGTWAGDRYSVVFKVRLGSSDPYDVEVSEGEIVNAAFSIHADGTAKRKHYVSFPYSIGVGVGGGDITAEKVSN